MPNISLQNRWMSGFLSLAAFAIAPSLASGGPIGVDTWYEFSFMDPNVFATGCQPNDPNGLFCIPSAGGNSTFLDAPAWTITVSASAASLKVTDAFFAGDIFVVLDNGSPLGTTSIATDNGHSCGSDPVVCFADADISHGTFALGPGKHSIMIETVASPSIAGSGYLEVVSLPEPGSLALLTVGALLSVIVHYRRLRTIQATLATLPDLCGFCNIRPDYERSVAAELNLYWQ